jgi:tryptophan synthase alpha chain
MNRIDAAFKKLRAAGRKGLVGYLTAGDPDAARSERNIRDAISAGIDVLELGIPFSDPTADGPAIQEASGRALAAGMTPRGVIEMVRRLRRDTQVPIVLFGYVNPIFVYGYEQFCVDASRAGADGMLVVDMPFEESGELRVHARANGLCLIPLVAPTTSRERASRILEGAEGFVYYIMFRGVTGARAGTAADLQTNLSALRECTKLPIAAGFGVGSGAQAAEAARAADAVVVGSAFVTAAVEGRLSPLVREIASALRVAPGGSEPA